MSIFAGWGVLLANVSKWFTPKESRERKLASLIRQRDAILDRESTWKPGDGNAEKLTAVLVELKYVQRLLDQGGRD